MVLIGFDGSDCYAANSYGQVALSIKEKNTILNEILKYIKKHEKT